MQTRLETQVIGQNVPRVDAVDKVTGEADFAADIRIPGLTHAKILRSTQAHAAIRHIDISKAVKIPGVRLVLTGDDPLNKRQGVLFADQPLIARGKTRYVGEPVACIVADSASIAEEALDELNIVLEELPGVFDVEEAWKPDCPVVIHPELHSYKSVSSMKWNVGYEKRPNVYHYWHGVHGNVDKAMQEADFVVENRYSSAMTHHVCMENHHVDVWPERGGGITIRTKNKAPFSLKAHIHHLFGIPQSRIAVVTPYMGADFGSSGGPYPDTLAVLLALRSKRPVRLSFDRKETFFGTTHRPHQVIYVRDGVRKSGEIIAREITTLTDAGAYTGASSIITYVSTIGSAAVGLYRIPNFHYQGYGIYTNQIPSGAFRGIGMPDITWAVEQQMDELSRVVRMDPIDFRMKHILQESEINCLGQPTHSIGAEECLKKVKKTVQSKQANFEKKEDRRRGWGIAIGCQSTPTHPPAFVKVKAHPDGFIEVFHCAIEQGQGADTVMTQVVCEILHTIPDRVKVAPKDTRQVPFGPRTGGSRSTFYLGEATRRACIDLKARILDIAASRLGAASKDELELREGSVFRKNQVDDAISLEDLFNPMGFVPEEGELVGFGRFTLHGAPMDVVTGQSERWVAYYSYAAYGVELVVDEQTGEIVIERVVGCCDMGNPIHPKMCEQQMEGAIGQGIGITLFEEMVMDRGRLLNANFVDYKIPTCLDTPLLRDTATVFAAAPHREGPFGAKGLGEVALNPFYAAVGNAFSNATGLRMKEMPMSKERVFWALRSIERGLRRRV